MIARDHEVVLMLPMQCRAGRGLLNWTQRELAEAASVGLSTVQNYENELRSTAPENQAAIQRALEQAGIEFIAAKAGKGVGVRLRKDA
jgi:transcriptional regulator with XRE-family HTH domain